MSCFRTVVARNGDAMPKVIRVELPEGVTSDGWGSFKYDIFGRRAAECFDRRWFAAWRECNRFAFAQQRAAFHNRLAELTS